MIMKNIDTPKKFPNTRGIKIGVQYFQKVCVTVLISISIFLTGCIGSRGDDGETFVRIDYHLMRPSEFNDNNAGTPNTVSYGTWYESEPGEYSFNYILNQIYYESTYIITVNEGGEGGLFWQKGEDGADKYLTIWCEPGGPDFEEYDE